MLWQNAFAYDKRSVIHW